MTMLLTFYQICYAIKVLKLSLFLFVFAILFFSNKSASSEFTVDDCRLLDTHFGNISGCDGGSWGGFLTNDCCGLALDEYLYILGKRANRTGLIYFNGTEQSLCLNILKNSNEEVLNCGFERLSSGGGSCYDYTVDDVTHNFAYELAILRERCNFSSTGSGFDSICDSCLDSWNDFGLDSGEGLNQSNIDVCRFTVLIVLTSVKIDDLNWIKAVDKCIGEHHFNEGPIQGVSRRKGKKLIAVLAVVPVLLVGIALLTGFVMWKLLKKRNLSAASSIHYGYKNISVKEIYAATNGLNMYNFIGQGIAGKVYKGILSDGKPVAIKHITKDGYAETFVREVTSLSHITHPNLVSLIGCCEKKDECFLVYELCFHGNLAQWLYGKDKILSWTQRLEIAIDCAQGLSYLHTYPDGYIVHRDIKPTNILLAENFRAKLSDFGLSKLMDVGQSYVSSEVRGTFGYVDPEYQRNHHVNRAGDVYSFGVVLLQLISGRRVINLNSARPKALDKTAKQLLRGGNIKEFVDPKLNGQFSFEAFNLTLNLALSCTAHKQQRPNMAQVVTRLEEALDISTSEETIFTDISFSN